MKYVIDLPKGTFGEVFKARCRADPKMIVALKRVLMDNEKEGPVLKICFGPPTTESKNLKNYANFNLGDLFFRSSALWSSQNVFGPPTAGRVVVDSKDRGGRPTGSQRVKG